MPEYPTSALVECDGGCGWKEKIRIEPGNPKWIMRFSAMANEAHDRLKPYCARKALTFYIGATRLLRESRLQDPESVELGLEIMHNFLEER